ncbi:MAG: hypothetical protein DRR16_05610 [Candidatus Parabeggiatoa sp. nov. 3]|nr:MAG: hypothetical protein DRR00_13675 [Gammaproteobacteria bacterium]RKZ65796.1 MAG: hypothetical protein DRQ99_11640 [Gammaproteobacteria bacterium]RKZ88149.1 MAG: hypothetical protein DRR16_05610 [Gammaproteobacteria bacterium]
MTIYHESGLRLTLPAGKHFRFQDCKAYKSLNGQNLKEMDFCWWQEDENRLWLIELKDYANLTPAECLPNHLLDNLIAKATDSLLMLAACWAKTGKGQEFLSCLPSSVQEFPRHPQQLKLKLFFILKIDVSMFKDEIDALKYELNNRLRGRVALFNIRHVSLVDHLTVINHNLLPLETLEPAPYV